VLHSFGPGKANVEGTRFLPPVLSPLIQAAERGEAIEPTLTALVKMFGFDTFLYGASLSPRPGQEAVSYVFTTLPRRWVAHYDECGYAEIDPRVLCTFESAIPFVWDQHTERGKSDRVDRFLDDAQAHGISSGVSFSVRSEVGGYVLVGFNSTRPEIDELRRLEISRNLGDMILLGIYFHDMFMKTVIHRGLPSKVLGAPLSPQEKRCLMLAAHGYTSRRIAEALEIAERTVELYFSQARTKLNVATRNEAIGKAIDERIIQRGQLPDILEEVRARSRGSKQLADPERPARRLRRV
jgi:DNA-binding CsgD family transcriptional regulator